MTLVFFGGGCTKLRGARPPLFAPMDMLGTNIKPVTDIRCCRLILFYYY